MSDLTKEWYARVQFQGKRQFFPLGTPSKAAAAKGRDIYFFGLSAATDNGHQTAPPIASETFQLP
jgi:hypothetical protein